LGALPNKDLKGNISLGKITGEGSNVISELQANDALDLGASAIDTLASTGNTLKLVKNVYINDKWNVTPFYAWRGAAKSTVIDQFSNVESSTYKGYGTYIPSARNIDVAHTFEDFCGGKSLTFTAPADIDVIVENTPAQKAISFDNSNPEERSQGDSRVCIAGSSMYLREDVRDGKTSFMLNFGSGGSFQNSPEGLWKLAIDGTEEAWFDLAAANPVNADGKPLVFMPSVKFNKVGSQITSVNVELYFWNGSTYVKVTDVEPMRKLISSVNASMSIDSGSSSTESRVQLTINDDGSITGAFDNSGDQDSPNPPMDAADVTSFAVYYEIGNASFRTEFR
jgi:hypothetical protein